MLIGFFDDTDLLIDEDDKKPDIFVYGGYFIVQERLSEFQERIGVIKRVHGLWDHAPLKWNMRDDSLRKFYDREHWLSPGMYDAALAKSAAMRPQLLGLLAEFEATILVSARYDQSHKPEELPTYFSWAFENLLQRMGLMAQVRYPDKNYPGFTVVADWPSAALERRMFDIYLGGYHFGHGISTNQNYYSGPLKDYRFADSLYHASTLHSGPLQIADMVVGCARDFLSWAIKGTKPQRIKGLFDLLVPRFYCSESGQIANYGFKLAKGLVFNGAYFDFEAKITEFTRLSQASMSSDN
jgi:hypothetical protein